MSFEGLSPELMLCVRIRRERLWCSRPASKRSRQVLRRLVDQTAWDPNLGSRRVLRPILPRTEVSERQPPFRQDARTQIDRPSRDVRTHRAKENTCDNHFARCFDEINEQKKEWKSFIVLCECGCLISRGRLSRHKKTLKHENIMKDLNTTTV